MDLKSIYSSLALSSLSALMIGCAAKEPDSQIPFIQPPELSEQDVVLTKLSEPELMQVLFDELSRIAWFARMTNQRFPPEDTHEGCFVYQAKPEANVVVVGADCTGAEPRTSGDSLDRTVQGSGVLRQLESTDQYSGSFNIQRFRPNQPKKVVRMAVFEPLMMMVDASSEGDPSTLLRAFTSTSEFKGIKPRKLKRAESWSSTIEGELNDPQTTPPRIERTKTMGLRYQAENGDLSEVTMVPSGRVSFAPSTTGVCLRPIGTFLVTATATTTGEDGKPSRSSTSATIVTTPEGFKRKDSTMVTPWPSSCFENTAG